MTEQENTYQQQLFQQEQEAEQQFKADDENYMKWNNQVIESGLTNTTKTITQNWREIT